MILYEMGCPDSPPCGNSKPYYTDTNMTNLGFYRQLWRNNMRVYKFGRAGTPEIGSTNGSLHAKLVDAQPGNLLCSSYTFSSGTKFNPGLPMYIINTPGYYLQSD
jgi:hypothetical protein